MPQEQSRGAAVAIEDENTDIRFSMAAIVTYTLGIRLPVVDERVASTVPGGGAVRLLQLRVEAPPTASSEPRCLAVT